MMHRRIAAAASHLLIAVVSILSVALPAFSQSTPKFAEMGDCALESGAVIRECRIAYRTVGTLNAEKSNAILFPTWLGGSSRHIVDAYLGPQGIVDTARFFVIVVDAFGNGISSSPSNSTAQPGADFPQVGIQDMVRMQHRLLREHFKLERLHAVMGISMGGMQALEWAVRYPDMMDKVVAIAGSPRLATYDRVLWETRLRTYQAARECKCNTPFSIWGGLRLLMEGTSAYANSPTTEEQEKVRRDVDNAPPMSEAAMFDSTIQLRAMLGHDIAKPYGDMTVAAKRIRARLMIVTAARDNVVSPGPARAFAKLADAEFLESAQCGHRIPTCDADSLQPAVRAFVSR